MLPAAGEKAGWVVFAAATPTAAADPGEVPENEGVEDYGFPPCQVTARDSEGSFTLAAAKGGGHDSASATTFALPGTCLTSDVSSAR